MPQKHFGLCANCGSWVSYAQIALSTTSIPRHTFDPINSRIRSEALAARSIGAQRFSIPSGKQIVAAAMTVILLAATLRTGDYLPRPNIGSEDVAPENVKAFVQAMDEATRARAIQIPFDNIDESISYASSHPDEPHSHALMQAIAADAPYTLLNQMDQRLVRAPWAPEVIRAAASAEPQNFLQHCDVVAELPWGKDLIIQTALQYPVEAAKAGTNPKLILVLVRSTSVLDRTPTGRTICLPTETSRQSLSGLIPNTFGAIIWARLRFLPSHHGQELRDWTAPKHFFCAQADRLTQRTRIA